MKRDKQEGDDRLSALSDSILIDILSFISEDEGLPEIKEIVRTCVLSKRWLFLWKSVPIIGLGFYYFKSSGTSFPDFVSSTTRDLHYWRRFDKISVFKVRLEDFGEEYIQDIDLWVHFAITVANVQGLNLDFRLGGGLSPRYVFPQFAYRNSNLKHLSLHDCTVKPFGSVNWSGLASLSITGLCVMWEADVERLLSGCPNLEYFEIGDFWGIRRLEINSEKLRRLNVGNYLSVSDCERLEISAPFVQRVELVGRMFFRLRNVDSLVTVVLNVRPELDRGPGDREDRWKRMCSYFNQLLQSVAHVEKVIFGNWSMQFLSGLELKGWQSPPSNWTFLKLTMDLALTNFAGICNILRGSLDLERLYIECRNGGSEIISDFTTEDERSRWFQSHTLKCSMQHLKNIGILQPDGPLSTNEFLLPLVQYLLKNAEVLEELLITARYRSENYHQMAQELLRFPRSSPSASVLFRNE